METALIQTRVDMNLKNDASRLFERLGLDMSTAIKIFLRRCLQENGIPFDVKIKERAYRSPEGMKAFLALRRQAAENGVSGMSLDEINAEISAARAERRQREGA